MNKEKIFELAKEHNIHTEFYRRVQIKVTKRNLREFIKQVNELLPQEDPNARIIQINDGWYGDEMEFHIWTGKERPLEHIVEDLKEVKETSMRYMKRNSEDNVKYLNDVKEIDEALP